MNLRSMIYPELNAFGVAERAPALRAAKDEPFDFVELAAMAVVLVAVTALTRYGLADVGFATRVAATIVNFVVALPLLAAGIAPFLVRRTRRGLRAQLRRRSHASRT